MIILREHVVQMEGMTSVHTILTDKKRGRIPFCLYLRWVNDCKESIYPAIYNWPGMHNGRWTEGKNTTSFQKSKQTGTPWINTIQV
jgi:hypothetical protein